MTRLFRPVREDSTIVEAQRVAERRGRERFVTEQPPYNILVRNVENEVLPVAQRYGMGVIPYSPLAGGWLSGRYRRDSQDGPMSPARQRLANRFDLSLPENQRKLEAAEQLSELADDAGLTLIQLAIAFVLRHPAITAPIIGPRTMNHLESQLAAADVILTDDVLDRIDKIVPPRPDPQPGRERLGQSLPAPHRPPALAPGVTHPALELGGPSKPAGYDKNDRLSTGSPDPARELGGAEWTGWVR